MSLFKLTKLEKAQQDYDLAVLNGKSASVKKKLLCKVAKIAGANNQTSEDLIEKKELGFNPSLGLKFHNTEPVPCAFF